MADLGTLESRGRKACAESDGDTVCRWRTEPRGWHPCRGLGGKCASAQALPFAGLEERATMERARTPRDDVFDVLSRFFGAPRTSTERTMFGKVVAELMEAGATPEETTKACEYVTAKFDKPSPFAVVKWFSVSLRQKPHVSELRHLRGLG